MDWGVIIIFCMVVVLGESNKYYEKEIIRYSCPTDCRVLHEHLQSNYTTSKDSTRVDK
jgi:hypothetical protein